MTQPIIQAVNYYERLGLEPSASGEDIKRAYGMAIRQFPPEKYQNEFKRIREAYEALSDVGARSQYDLEQDEATRVLVESGQTALEEEDWDTAIAALKRVLVRHPNARHARQLLGFAYHGSGSELLALNQFVRLTGEAPRNPNYWCYRGLSAQHLERWEEAENSLEQAVGLAPEDSENSIRLARCLRLQDKDDAARDVLQKAIHADGKVDYEDFGCFFELITLELLRGRLEEVKKLTDRVEAVVRDEFQALRSAYRFASLAHQLLEANAFSLALAVAEASHRLAPRDTDIADLTNAIRRNKVVVDQWAQAKEDDKLRPTMRLAVVVQLQCYLDAFDDDATKRAALSHMAESVVQELCIATASGRAGPTMRSELAYLDKTYPALAQVLGDGFRDVIVSTRQELLRVELKCPHCGTLAYAQNVTSALHCPDCTRSFTYVREGAAGSIRRSATAVDSNSPAGGWLTRIAIGGGILLLIQLAQNC